MAVRKVFLANFSRLIREYRFFLYQSMHLCGEALPRAVLRSATQKGMSIFQIPENLKKICCAKKKQEKEKEKISRRFEQKGIPVERWCWPLWRRCNRTFSDSESSRAAQSADACCAIQCSLQITFHLLVLKVELCGILKTSVRRRTFVHHNAGPGS